MSSSFCFEEGGCVPFRQAGLFVSGVSLTLAYTYHTCSVLTLSPPLCVHRLVSNLDYKVTDEDIKVSTAVTRSVTATPSLPSCL